MRVTDSGQTDRETDRQTDGQTDGETDRQMMMIRVSMVQIPYGYDQMYFTSSTKLALTFLALTIFIYSN